ncbi:MAG: response regulator, partial [Syntrophaceae bacterium]|nr:response regulator [Syntrophaceae bacterium]
FNLIIVDLTMPEMDGIETLKKLRNIKPSTKVILCSGYDENENKSKLNQAEFPDAFLKNLLILRLRQI